MLELTILVNAGKLSEGMREAIGTALDDATGGCAIVASCKIIQEYIPEQISIFRDKSKSGRFKVEG